MRHLLMIATLVSALLYISVTVQGSTLAGGLSVEALAAAVAAAGATPQQAVVHGWAPGTRADAARLRTRLGANAAVNSSDGYVSVTLKPAVTALAEAVRLLQTEMGRAVRLTVEVEGYAADRRNAEQLVLSMAEALRLTGRQAWKGSGAASMAGLSPLLPAHSLGLNVQVAARTEGTGTRLWAGWPLLQTDY
jgi:hypothetical protein